MFGKGHIYFALTKWGFGSQGKPRSHPHVRKSVNIITQLGENYIQTLSLIRLIWTLRFESGHGMEGCAPLEVLQYHTYQISYPSIMAFDPIAEITTSVHRMPNISVQTINSPVLIVDLSPAVSPWKSSKTVC